MMAERNQSHSEHATTRNRDESALLSGEGKAFRAFQGERLYDSGARVHAR